jgi:cytoskeletal protein CcmA (bactofilin family)
MAVVISGSVVGDIIASKKIVLHKTARVQGDLQTPTIVVEEGAQFNGNLSMNSASPSATLSAPTGNLKAIKGGSENDSAQKI